MKNKKQEWNAQAIQWFFLVGGLLLVYKTAQLQLFDPTFRKEASSATISKQVLHTSRGLMYDRDGKLLVYNDPIYDIEVTFNQLDPDMDTALLFNILDINKNFWEEALDKDWSSPRFARYAPFILQTKIHPDRYAVFAEHQHKFPGISAQRRHTRGYATTYGAQVLGFISEIDRQSLQREPEVYQHGDIIGKYGLEKFYERSLRGVKGLRYILKDKWGNNMGPFDGGRLDTPALSGQNLFLTLDMDLQAYAEALMQGKKGSIVAIEPETGEILCLASSPSYDPQVLALNRNRGDAFRLLAKDTLKPFFNRAISANYPAGSLMKPIYGLAAQQMGVVNPQDYYRCQGAYYYRNARWGCHAGPGVHNMRDAIQVSCNSYFYELYRKMVDKHGASRPELGLNELNSILREMGLGQPLGIDLDGESSGFLPNPNFYDRMYSFQQADWRSTYIISNGIGQGELQLSPIQMANLAAMMANRGIFYTPHLVRAQKTENGPLQEITRPVRQTGLDTAYFSVVLEGMQRAVDYGTARGARVPNVNICGKTGTSENPHGKDHSVFYAFAPRYNPKIAVAVFVENGGYGGTYAAPMGGLIIEKYLKDSIAPTRQWWEDRMMQAQLTPNL